MKTWIVKVRAVGRQTYIGSFDEYEKAREAFIYACNLWGDSNMTYEKWLLIVRHKFPLRDDDAFRKKFDCKLSSRACSALEQQYLVRPVYLE